MTERLGPAEVIRRDSLFLLKASFEHVKSDRADRRRLRKIGGSESIGGSKGPSPSSGKRTQIIKRPPRLKLLDQTTRRGNRSHRRWPCKAEWRSRGLIIDRAGGGSVSRAYSSLSSRLSLLCGH